MKEFLIIRILEYLKSHLRKKHWRRAWMCMAAVVVFCTTYLLILPAISMTKGYAVLSAGTLSAWSGETLSVRVTARAEDNEDGKVFLLLTEGAGAELSGSYAFNEDGICIITDDEGREIELHRIFREDKKALPERDITADYWFALEAGEQTAFTLLLSDEVEEGRFLRAAEAVKSIAGKSSETTGSEAPAAATASDAAASPKGPGLASVSNASKAAGAAAASKAAGVATVSDAVSTASRSDALKEAEAEEEDGFVRLPDGEILNDLEEDDTDENGEPTETVAFLKLSSGAGRDLDEAVRDAGKNADKREGAQLKFIWKDIAESVYITPEMLWSGDGAQVAVIFDGDAKLPAEAVLSVREIEPGTEEYAAYLAQAVSVVRASGSDASKEMGVDYARFFDICILDGDGTELEPAAPVKVVITYDEAVSVGSGGGLDVMHFHEEEAPEVLEIEKSGTARDAGTLSADGAGSSTGGEGADVDALSFTASRFSVFGVVRSTIEKLVLASDGQTYRVSVTCGAGSGVPEGAELAVSEITESEAAYREYAEKAETALGLEKGSASFLRLFDIKILGLNGEKVEITAPVDVAVSLADMKSSSLGSPEEIRVVHFADGAETGDVMREVSVSGDTVSFQAEGFSAYAIVTGPGALPIGWTKVEDMEDMVSHAASGLYIGHTLGYYFTDGITNISGTRTGITKTRPAQEYPASTAVKYYFEQVAGTTNQFKVYCIGSGGTKRYVVQSSNSLNLTTEENATVFTIENGTSENVFRVRGNGGYYWNMQGGENGASFAAYNSAADVNAQFHFWYYEDVEEDPYGLDGKTYGLMNWNGGAGGKAVMNSQSDPGILDAKALEVMTTADNVKRLFVPKDSDVSMWSFHWVSGDNYYLTTVVDGSTKYLKITEDGPSLVSEPDESCLIQVIPGTGTHSNEICLKSGNSVLTYSGTVDSGFTVNGSAGTEWLHLVELSELTSEYFLTFSAAKVSVSDTAVTNGSSVIVYTRHWNENTLSYDYYAVGSDGMLVPVYDTGDSIEWVSGQINTLLWDFVEYYWEGTSDPNYYYELYNEYSEKFIAPQVTGGQILSDNAVGINLNGRRDGRYSSTIMTWDESKYSYVGLKVENGQIVPCPKSEAMEFYFAIMQERNIDDQVHMVRTVDNTQYGITMKLVDLDNAQNMSGRMNAFLGSNAGGVGRNLQQGLLSADLGADGYPRVTSGAYSGHSLQELYNGANDVNHLFIQSVYDENGYFEYDSTQNFASLRGATGGDFTVYKELGSYDSGSGRNTLKHGQFFPFNDLKPGVFAVVNGKNLYTFDETSYEKPLPEGNPRKYERLYSIEHDNKTADYYFGMELEASFTQTPSGLDAWGHDIIFEFTGDDDFWLYVDGELVIDLGGIHSAVPGSVNFSTGNVMVNGTHTTLKALFKNNYEARNPDKTEAEVAAYLDGIFDGEVFKDFTNHTMRVFYMERGAGASNLRMRFNLASVKRGTVQLSKRLSGVDDTGSIMAEFPYQILYKTEEGGEEKYLRNKVPGGPAPNVDQVFYKDTVRPVKYRTSAEIGGITYNDVFFLKPDETADITFPEGTVSYRIVECCVNTQVFDSVRVNGTEIQGTGAGAEDREDFGIDSATTDDRPKVDYINEVDRDALRNLTIQKQLYREDGVTRIHYPDDETTFSFRLSLSPEFEPLEAANMHTYHVKDPDGNYCRWDAEQQKFVKIEPGITDYSALSDDQKASASFTTSVYGSIARIPVDHTVEIRNILVGTQFKVEERPSEVPDGYSFQRYVYNGDDSPNGAEAGIEDVMLSDPAPEPEVIVRNLKGWGLRMNKVWSDEDYMSEREPAYFGVYITAGNNGGTSGTGGNGQPVLVEGTLRQLPFTADPQTLYWYFPHLVEGTTSLDQYFIREVNIISGTPAVDSDGAVTNESSLTFAPVEDGAEISFGGRQKGETASSPFTYTVSYAAGTITEDSNVRVDVVTNDRPGILLKKTEWDGETPLAGAVFTIKDNEGNLIGTFTSDETGLITEAFLRDNVDYMLTETDAPQTWHGLEAPMTVTLHDRVLTVSGSVDSSYYIVGNDTSPQTLTIKDRPYTFQVIKKDGNTGALMAGVRFNLHRQVKVGDVTTIDLNPVPGYEGLLTDADGVVPQLDNTLPPGVYELREMETQSGYQLLPSYIHFAVTETGKVIFEPDRNPEGVEFSGFPEEEGPGTVAYVLTIQNFKQKKVSVWKTDMGFSTIDEGAEFALYKAEDYDDSAEAPAPGAAAVMTGSIGQDGIPGILTLGELRLGEYRLVETKAPDGYMPASGAVRITVSTGGVAALQGGNQALVCVKGDQYWVAGQDDDTWQVRVWNSTDFELPSTGGPGTRSITIAGTLLTAAAAVLLLLRRKTLRGH